MSGKQSQSRYYAPQPPSRTLLALFGVYQAWYMRRHFHAIRVSNAELFQRDGERPMIVFLNHASWWDPLTCISVARTLLREADHYAPMDAEALEHYGFFRRLGIFPVEINTPRGAAQFLRTSGIILAKRNTVLWVTPQGDFADVRARPAVLKPGLGALASRLAGDAMRPKFLPLAIEYTYWYERLPEVLLRFGDPVRTEVLAACNSAEWTETLRVELTRTQDELAMLALARDPSSFKTIAVGGAGVGGLYSVWQRLRARVTGRRYSAEHADIKRTKESLPRA